MDAPLGPQPIPGRIFGSDWTIANVAKLLRFNAGQDFMRIGPLTGGMRDISDSYHRKTSARHLPSGVTVTFRRDVTGNWHAELCFSGLDHYLRGTMLWLRSGWRHCSCMIARACSMSRPISRPMSLKMRTSRAPSGTSS